MARNRGTWGLDLIVPLGAKHVKHRGSTFSSGVQLPPQPPSTCTLVKHLNDIVKTILYNYTYSKDENRFLEDESDDAENADECEYNAGDQ